MASYMECPKGARAHHIEYKSRGCWIIEDKFLGIFNTSREVFCPEGRIKGVSGFSPVDLHNLAHHELEVAKSMRPGNGYEEGISECKEEIKKTNELSLPPELRSNARDHRLKKPRT